MRYLIVGISGYLGGALAAHLKSNGHEVHGVYRTWPKDEMMVLPAMDSLIQGDISCAETMEAVLEIRPEIVIYTASQNHNQSEFNYQKSINLDVAPVLELGRRLSTSTGFQKFIYFSTFQVYGKTIPGETITEDTVVNPVNMYGFTHLMSETALKFLSEIKNLNVSILRLANAYGAPIFSSADCWWLVINDLCLMASKNKKIVLKSDGSPQRDFIHLRDVCRVVEGLSIVDYDGTKILNLASGETVTILELAFRVAKLYKKKNGIDIPVYTPNGLAVEEMKVDKFQVQLNPIIQELFNNSSQSLDVGIMEVFSYIENHIWGEV